MGCDKTFNRSNRPRRRYVDDMHITSNSLLPLHLHRFTYLTSRLKKSTVPLLPYITRWSVGVGGRRGWSEAVMLYPPVLLTPQHLRVGEGKGCHSLYPADTNYSQPNGKLSKQYAIPSICFSLLIGRSEAAVIPPVLPIPQHLRVGEGKGYHSLHPGDTTHTQLHLILNSTVVLQWTAAEAL